MGFRFQRPEFPPFPDWIEVGYIVSLIGILVLLVMLFG